VRDWLDGRWIEAVRSGRVDRSTATLLLQTLGGGLPQWQMWFRAGLDVGRVRSVHGLVEGLGDGDAGLQQHTRRADWSVVDRRATAGFADNTAASL
jgi:hypothetical protein